MAPLPHWPPGTVALLATGAGAPHVIPVSTALRAADDRVLLALAHRRESLRRLREDPAGGARAARRRRRGGHGARPAAVVADPLPGAENVVAVELRVTEVQDHGLAALRRRRRRGVALGRRGGRAGRCGHAGRARSAAR
jgi:hypothetical protein